MLKRLRQYRMGVFGLCRVVAAKLAYGVMKGGSNRKRQALEMFLGPLVIFPFAEQVV
jgi:predicted nucleic acid-binding protein